jgi:alpha-glucosidase
MLAMLNLTLWGTVFLHQGQEIGMINLPTDWPLEYWADVKTKNVVNK